jgi:uncharacterized protein
MNNQRHPLAELSLFLLAILGFSLIGTLLALLIAYANGMNISALMNDLTENSPVGERNTIRFMLLLNHLFSFLIPSIFFTWFLYKKDSLDFLTLKKTPSIQNIILGILILLVALPFVQYTFFLNKMMPLPEWMHSAENNTEILIKGLLKTDYTYEVFLNVLVIALIPAIGEELVFRGIVQQKIMQLLNNNHHVSIWLTSGIFSAIHLQFEGFFPRMILGAVLGYLFYYTKNIWVAIVAHFFNNASQIVAYQAFKDKKTTIDLENMEVPWVAGLLSLAMVLGLIYYLKVVNKNENLAPS